MEKEAQTVILDSITEGVFTVDRNWEITFFNKAAEKITGITRQQAIGQLCKDILRSELCEKDCALRKTMETGRPIINKPVHIVDSKGNRKAISITTAILKDKRGKIIGGVETFRDMSLVEQLRKEIRHGYSFEDIISRNHQVQKLFSILPNVARSNAAVLITGETGTGKELFARAIHNISPRKNKPFVAVNCGALPDTLLESELFGYKAGAFTDARKDKAGRFALAEGGTIFLDEIADTSASVQVKLLRVLQEKTYEPLGSTSSCRADVRVIAATNKDIEEFVAQDKFRRDLYYRVNVVKLALPALRERREDIPLLIDHFISRFNPLRNKNITAVTDEVLAILLEYEYPGNVRELENIIEHCFVLCQSEIIQREYLPAMFQKKQTDESVGLNKAVTLEEMERIFIKQALRQNNGNRTAAARQLGINKSTLFRKMKAFDITNKIS
ncbi:MAG: sigma 54-interacting transcriptional regulator [Sedimentisphaerales bacterium]|nr:sigma 54-interacting transcriptional regulator [Sedimentisphaerales bacterium]